MAQQLDDVAHWWGGDLQLSPTGDLARVNGADRSKQRIVRRLCTNPGEMLSDVTYGGGVPEYVGSVEDDAAISGRMRSQMLKEASVAPQPPPTVALVSAPDQVSVDITYVALPDKQPVALAFSVAG